MQFFVLELPRLCIESLHVYTTVKFVSIQGKHGGASISCQATLYTSKQGPNKPLPFNVVSSKEPVTFVGLPGQGCQHAGGQTLPGSKCPVHRWWCQIIRQEALCQMHSADVCMSQQVLQQ